MAEPTLEEMRELMVELGYKRVGGGKRPLTFENADGSTVLLKPEGENGEDWSIFIPLPDFLDENADKRDYYVSVRKMLEYMQKHGYDALGTAGDPIDS